MSSPGKRLQQARRRQERAEEVAAEREAFLLCQSDHDGCDGCDCMCHVPLKPSEMLALRALLEKEGRE